MECSGDFQSHVHAFVLASWRDKGQVVKESISNQKTNKERSKSWIILLILSHENPVFKIGNGLVFSKKTVEQFVK